MKVMLHKNGLGHLSVYVPKKDLEEEVVEESITSDGKVLTLARRCFKVCGRNVLGMKPMNEFGEFIDEDEDEDGDIERYVMTIIDAAKCIGCEACARICPKKCQTHEALAV